MGFEHALEAALAAVLQGVAEFFPVSSSGHLALFHAFFPDNRLGFAFDVFLNFGTCLSILVYFHRDLFHLLRGALSKTRDCLSQNFSEGAQTAAKDEERPPRKIIDAREYFSDFSVRYVAMIVVSILPVGFVGVFAEPLVAGFGKDMGLLAIGFFLTSGVLVLCSKLPEGRKDAVDLSFASIFWVGVAQVFAVFPGVSRMGILLLAFIYLGASRSHALKFIFFSALPIGLGSVLLEIAKLPPESYMDGVNLGAMFLAFLVGLGSLAILKAYVERLKFSRLAAYVFILGLLSWFWAR